MIINTVQTLAGVGDCTEAGSLWKGGSKSMQKAQSLLASETLSPDARSSRRGQRVLLRVQSKTSLPLQGHG